MIVRFRLGNLRETRPVHGKLDHDVSAGSKRDGFKQLHVSVKFTKITTRGKSCSNSKFIEFS